MNCYDLIVMGGGLHGSLVARAVLHARPQARVALIEAGPTLGGNHLWSFHEGDVPAAAEVWLAPLVEFDWPRYEVRFPGRRRVLATRYRTITSERLHQVTTEALAKSSGGQLFLGRRVRSCSDRVVVLDDGSELAGEIVLDGRGIAATPEGIEGGYQKFLGLELLCRSEHGVTHPVLMDATVPQLDGFRFFYLLPFDSRRLFVEDTYFSDSADLDVDTLRARVLAHARAMGIEVEATRRVETGILPMPWSEGARTDESGLCIGTRGGWYHPATAYSIPAAVRMALAVSAIRNAEEARTVFRRLRRRHDKQAGFARLLNLLLFRCYEPDQRVHVFERFYGLSESTISRFYSLEMTVADRLRILSGRPPAGFSLARALRGPEIGQV